MHIYLTFCHMGVTAIFSSTDITETNAELLCSSEKQKEIRGYTVKDSQLVAVTMKTLCDEVIPPVMYLKYLSYSGKPN